MAEIDSGEVIIMLPSNLIAESRHGEQYKQGTFKLINIDVIEVV
jgi:hypothetical protein